MEFSLFYFSGDGSTNQRISFQMIFLFPDPLIEVSNYRNTN
jgi:hypothetical protein